MYTSVFCKWYAQFIIKTIFYKIMVEFYITYYVEVKQCVLEFIFVFFFFYYIIITFISLLYLVNQSFILHKDMKYNCCA